RFGDADPSWRDILDRWRVDVVVWPRRAAIVGQLAADSRWERRYDDDLAAVFVRRPPPAPAVPADGTGERAAPAAPRDLQAVVERFVAALPVPFSVVVQDRASGTGALHLADRQVLSAS